MAAYASVVRQYRESSIAAGLSDASPHRLIAMLYEGALERLALAQSGISFNNFAAKLRGIDTALDILNHLRDVLDFDAGGRIARNLDALYEYMSKRLIHAKLNDDLDAIKEVSALLRTIKTAWDKIAPAGT